MTNALIVTFVCASIGFMMLILGFFVQRWVTLIDKSLESIVAELKQTREELFKLVSEHEHRLDNHDERLKNLYEIGHNVDDCPFIDVANPHRRQAPRV